MKPGFFQFRIKALPRTFLRVIGNLLCIFTILGFFNGPLWFLDFFTHFRLQYLVALGLLAGVLFGIRRYRGAWTYLLFAGVNGVVLLPLFLGPAPAGEGSDPSLRAMLVNVQVGNTRYDRVEELVRTFDPDFIVVEELSARWLKGLEGLRKRYPHFQGETRDDCFGIGLFSKHPFTASRIVTLEQWEIPSVVARVKIQGRPLTVMGTHPLRPGPKRYIRSRNEQLAALPAFLRSLEGPVLLLGDLNTTPWSCHYRCLVEESGFHDSSRGRGYQPSWPAPLFFLWIPIDHCLYSPGIQLIRKQTGPSVGSDHFPLIVDFRLDEEKGNSSDR